MRKIKVLRAPPAGKFRKAVQTEDAHYSYLAPAAYCDSCWVSLYQMMDGLSTMDSSDNKAARKLMSALGRARDAIDTYKTAIGAD